MSILSEKLREKRRESGLKVQEVLDRLKTHEVFISDKTLYNWENGIRNPNADEFFALCEIYEVDSFDEFRETKKSPEPERSEDEKNIQMIVSGLTDLLVRAGWVADGGDLTDAQLRTLASYVIGLNAYFNGQS